MKALYPYLLNIHILFGAFGLLSGSINLMLKKGGVIHKKIGFTFVLSMLITGISALLLATFSFNVFLFIVGIFTIYLVGTGQRYMQLRNLGKGQGPKLGDWILSYSMLIVGIIFICWGAYLLVFESDLMGITLLVFGGIGIQSVRKDLQNYRSKIKYKMYWLREHIIRITAAYIASFTAFIVVNQEKFPDSIPQVVFWLLPTIVLTPLISFWVRKYTKN